jgi:hypothetical protein
MLVAIYHIFGLTFLNPEKASDCSAEDLIGPTPRGEEYPQFAEYLTEIYMDPEALFPTQTLVISQQ